MIKIITAMNNPNLNQELKKEKNVQILYKDIFYKEGILEILEKNKEINYIIIDENLSGEIELNKLIEKILEKNKKIKIIITIKKYNKNKIEINNNKIIKIYYEGKINLNKIKNNKKMKEEKKNKIKYFQKIKQRNYKIDEEKNGNSKMITIFGERQVGKSIIAINLSYYLSSKNCTVLLVELNEENPSIFSILRCKKVKQKRCKNKKKLKNSYRKTEKIFIPKYVDKQFLEKKIVKVNKKINLLSYNKLINYNFINSIKNKYDYLIIENNIRKNKLINRKIINNSEKNIIIIKPNLQGIKNSKKIIEKNNLNKINNLKIIINNFNKYSIDEKIIKIIFKKNEIIGKIENKNIYDNLINKNFKNIKYKYLIKDFKRIGEQLWKMKLIIKYKLDKI